MNADEQEALSRRYAHGVWALTLSSGRVAAFSHPMQNEFVVADTLAEAEAAIRALRPKPQPRFSLDLNLDDLI